MPNQESGASAPALSASVPITDAITTALPENQTAPQRRASSIPAHLKASVRSLWRAPRRFENLATRVGVAAVLTMSAIQTAYFFGLASPDPVEKAKAIVFSGWMDFCLFMAFIRAQRASAQEDVGKALAWFVGCLPLAGFTFLCNFMFSSHWQPPDPLALERVGLSPLVALWIYACVPLVAVVYGTLFTVKDITREEKQRRQRAKEEALWQAEIADPRGRLRKMRLMRRVLAEQLGLDLEEEDAEEQALFATYEDLLAERGISLVDREAPVHFEALLREMRQLSIHPRAPNAVALFRVRRTERTTLERPPQMPPTSKQISPTAFGQHTSLAPSVQDDGKRSLVFSTQQRKSSNKASSVVPEPITNERPVLQTMLTGGGGEWPTHLTVEEFIQHTKYNPDYVKRLVRRGEIKSEAVEGERRIPVAELARFALERLSEEMAAKILAEMSASSQNGQIVEADQPVPPPAAALAEEEE